MFIDQAFLPQAKPGAYYVENGTLISNLVAIYYHLDDGKVDCKTILSKTFEIIGITDIGQ